MNVTLAATTGSASRCTCSPSPADQIVSSSSAAQAISRPVTTQLYLEGEPGNTDDEYYHTALLVPCTVGDDGVKRGTYDFVIQEITEDENVTPETLAARVSP